MEHQEIYEWLKKLAFKNCDKENREQIFWFFEDILEDEIKVEKQEEEIERLNNIINESAEEILKELEENHHLSYGAALAIRQKLLDYRELKGSDK